jgi:hypothetical protein
MQNLAAANKLNPAAKSASPKIMTPEKLYEIWGIKPTSSIF